jgi:hypothetical protein
MTKELNFISADILGSGQQVFYIPDLNIIVHQINLDDGMLGYEPLYFVNPKNIKAVTALLQTNGFEEIVESLTPLIIKLKK